MAYKPNPFKNKKRDTAKFILGAAIVLASMLLAGYIGGYSLFYCGIVDVIDQIKTDVNDSAILALGIVKILGATLAASLIILVGKTIGFKIIEA